MLLFIDFTKVE